MKPVFVGNIDYETRSSDLERLFGKFGRLERVDMKSGYAFVYFEDERDAEDAIRKLDNTYFGYEKRKLAVEWSKGERGRPRREEKAYVKPSKTLFVVNFDPDIAKERDIERHFEPYGKVVNVRIRKNFSFVEFASQEDATKAFEATQGSKIMDKVVSVEYAKNADGERDDRHGGGGSPRRSRSPAYRKRPSPDYGRPRSPEYDRYKGPAADDRRRSPAAYERRRSPAAYEKRSSPVAYERRRSPAAYEKRSSPAAYERRRSPDYGRQRSPVFDRYRSRSPVPRGRS